MSDNSALKAAVKSLHDIYDVLIDFQIENCGRYEDVGDACPNEADASGRVAALEQELCDLIRLTEPHWSL